MKAMQIIRKDLNRAANNADAKCSFRDIATLNVGIAVANIMVNGAVDFSFDTFDVVDGNVTAHDSENIYNFVFNRADGTVLVTKHPKVK